MPCGMQLFGRSYDVKKKILERKADLFHCVRCVLGEKKNKRKKVGNFGTVPWGCW